MNYLIRDYEAGNLIESCDTLEEAQAIVQQYEKQDKADGTYTEDFYEIVLEHETTTTEKEALYSGTLYR